MKKIIGGGNRAASITLDGSECEVIFGSKYNVFAVKSDSEVTVALESGKSKGDDGVMVCPAGESIMYPHMRRIDRCYITGAGNVQIFASNTAVNPFKGRSKGGDDRAALLPHSDGLTAYFDYRKFAFSNGWMAVTGNLLISTLLAVNDDGSVRPAVSNGVGVPVLLPLTSEFTAYIIFKYVNSTSDGRGVFSQYHSSNVPAFNLYARNKKIAIYSNADNGNYFSDVSATDYHVCAISFLNGIGTLYIDGVQKYSNPSCYTPIDSDSYVLENSSNLKALIFFESTVQSAEDIAENSRYLIQKYGIGQGG